MCWSQFLALAALAAYVVAESFIIENSVWDNVRYYRNIDLSKSYVSEVALVEVINKADSPQDLYIFPVNDGYDVIESVSHLQVFDHERSREIQPIKLAEGLYAIKMPFPVAPGSTFSLKVVYRYTNSLEPLPAKIGLSDTQQLLLKFNKYCYSPYTTHEYSLTLMGLAKGLEYDLQLEQYNSPNVADLPELNGRIEEQSKVLTYGPAQVTLEPYTVQPLGLIYEHQKPMAHVLNLQRNFWIPALDIGVVLIEDYYELTNHGAALNTGFSRADWLKGRYEQSPSHFSLVRLRFPIDHDAPFDNYYFTDKVGVVSTHSTFNDDLVFYPRYPIFGGWKYNFTMGWSNSIDSIVRKVRDVSDVYIAKVPVLNNLGDVSYDNVKVNIYLPENAEFLNATASLEEKSVSVGRDLSYLDVSEGHVKVTLEYENLVDDLAAAFIFVKYRYTAQSYWSKVYKIAAFVFTGLMSFYALGLVDLSIRK